jgi:flagellar motor switch protein FliN
MGNALSAGCKIIHRERVKNLSCLNPSRRFETMSESEMSSEEQNRADENLATPSSGRNLDTILRIPVSVQVVLGSAMMPVANLLKLGRGAVILLDHRVGEPLDIIVNGRVIARGEIVVVEDDNSRLGVSLTEIAGPARTAA